MKKLSQIEKHSALWTNIEKGAVERLQVLRETNDSQSLDALETAEIRGRISEIKLLIDLAVPDQKIDSD